jgi:hypothetical protein
MDSQLVVRGLLTNQALNLRDLFYKRLFRHGVGGDVMRDKKKRGA